MSSREEGDRELGSVCIAELPCIEEAPTWGSSFAFSRWYLIKVSLCWLSWDNSWCEQITSTILNLCNLGLSTWQLNLPNASFTPVKKRLNCALAALSQGWGAGLCPERLDYPVGSHNSLTCLFAPSTSAGQADNEICSVSHRVCCLISSHWMLKGIAACQGSLAVLLQDYGILLKSFGYPSCTLSTLKLRLSHYSGCPEALQTNKSMAGVLISLWLCQLLHWLHLMLWFNSAYKVKYEVCIQTN